MSILELYCSVDDFGQTFPPQWEPHVLASAQRQRRQRATALHPSELMTIMLAFHQSPYRTFKTYYTEHVLQQWWGSSPHLVSYPRLVALLPTILVLLTAEQRTQLGSCTGISFLDSTALHVCHNARISQHRVFASRAKLGKTSVGWFFGFRLHLVVNDRGELLAFCLRPGNFDDLRPVPKLLAYVRRRFGKLFADRSSISQPLAEQLLIEHGIQLITKMRKNMRNRLLDVSDKLLLRKRAIIETIDDQLKNICPI